MIINFFISQAHSPLFESRDIKRRNWERQIARNGKLDVYFKNNFNLLVMNVTQLNFLNCFSNVKRFNSLVFT